MLLLTPLQGRTKTLRQCMEKTSVFFPCTVNGPQSVTQVTQPYDMLRSVGKAGLSFGYKNLKNSRGTVVSIFMSRGLLLFLGLGLEAWSFVTRCW